MKHKSQQQTKLAHEKVWETLVAKKEAAMKKLENANREAIRLETIAKKSK